MDGSIGAEGINRGHHRRVRTNMYRRRVTFFDGDRLGFAIDETLVSAGGTQEYNPMPFFVADTVVLYFLFCA